MEESERPISVRKFELGKEDNSEFMAATSPEERVAMVWPLTLQAWAFRGVDLRGVRLRKDVLHIRELGAPPIREESSS